MRVADYVIVQGTQTLHLLIRQLIEGSHPLRHPLFIDQGDQMQSELQLHQAGDPGDPSSSQPLVHKAEGASVEKIKQY
jgi:hypothetical protein